MNLLHLTKLELDNLLSHIKDLPGWKSNDVLRGLMVLFMSLSNDGEPHFVTLTSNEKFVLEHVLADEAQDWTIDFLTKLRNITPFVLE